MQQKLKRRIPSILLTALTVISLFLILKSSGDPIINPIENTIFEDVFLQFSYGNNIIFDISIGYLVSAIFYFIVVFLPDRRKNKDVEPYINSKVEEVIFSLYALNRDIITTAGKNYCFKTLKKEELIDACSLVNPKENKSLFHNGPNSVFEQHFGYKCFNTWSRITSNIDEAFRFLPYIDTELVFYFNEIRSSNLRFSVSNLKDCEACENTNIAVHADEFYKVYLLTKSLRDYYVSEHKKEFRNDPWK
jgi:hypothetical protein